MFFDLLPLPIIWLGFYALGQTTGRFSLSARCYTYILLSIALLLMVCGFKACVFYIALGSGILVAARLISAARNAAIRKALFILSTVAVALMILVFLYFRPYFHKFFIYLPSLSYLGFRGIAYLSSVYKRRDVGFAHGMIQIFFFPVLFTGPITRVENYQETEHDSDEVLRRLTLGLAMLVAGRFCGEYVLQNVNETVLATTHCFWFWLGAAANSFELYFIFAGYSHLVIGLGLLAGFRLPENFNSPYLATSVSDFWRRWHMSLSYWIRDYLYIPLGGNRSGISRKCANLMLAMGICGAWHGLEWHYLAWGLFHGALLSSESLMNHAGFRPLQKALPRSYRPVKIAVTFLLVTFGWLIFRYPTDSFVIYMRGLFS